MAEKGIQTFHFNNKFNKIVRFHSPKRAIAYYHDRKIDLLDGKVSSSNFSEIRNVLKVTYLQNASINPRVMHLSYNLGRFFQPDAVHLQTFSQLNPLMIDIEYESVSDFNPLPAKWGSLGPILYPDFNEYGIKFAECYSALLRGDSYQLNLTCPFKLNFKGFSIEKFIGNFFTQKKKLGAYAHASIIPSLGWSIVSNSPECLFQAQKKPGNKNGSRLWSIPIKGSKRVMHETERKRINRMLYSDVKNHNELNIIVDLVRNDLSKIDLPCSKVIASKINLAVPGLAHLASVIQIDLDEKINLFQILKALFPGGSITGAPKIKVMKLLQEIESYNRNFYTGSTVVLWKPESGEAVMAGSINIRTLEIDLKAMKGIYSAGGGITLRSDCSDEYDEMLAKFESFKELL